MLRRRSMVLLMAARLNFSSLVKISSASSSIVAGAGERVISVFRILASLTVRLFKGVLLKRILFPSIVKRDCAVSGAPILVKKSCDSFMIS